MVRGISFALVLVIMASRCDASEILRRSFQTSDGVKLSFLEAGQDLAGKKNPTLVLLTGWSMPATIWRKQLEVFGHRYDTLALDPRGQGESEIPATGYTAERRAADIHEFLLPRSKVLLIGWSLGAIEALQTVYMYGAAPLAGLVLVDNSVGEDPAPAPGGNFKQRLRENRDKTMSEFVRAIFATRRDEGELNELAREAKRLKLEDSLALLDYPFERSHWKMIALGFKKPLLYAVTRQFGQQAANLKKHRPATQVEVFNKAGHALFVDEPERFNALIEKFAEKMSR
ncbi:MAG TPA: alpha/beta hydrolase [Candidatus Binatia bacterium]|nr:alpha/beta hydrolase [Candidatus Binatia bacterium]